MPPASTWPVAAAWLLVQGEEGVDLADREAITANRPIDAAWVGAQLDLLAGRGLVTETQLTASGHATAERLLDANRRRLTALVAYWSYDDDPRVNDAITRLAEELAREPVGT